MCMMLSSKIISLCLVYVRELIMSYFFVRRSYDPVVVMNTYLLLSIISAGASGEVCTLSQNVPMFLF